MVILCNRGLGLLKGIGFALGVGSAFLTMTACRNSSVKSTQEFALTAAPSPNPKPSVSPTPVPSPSPTSSPSPTPSPSPSPSPSPFPTPTSSPPPVSGGLSAVWANDGGDKVTRDEVRASNNPASVLNSVWTGSKVQIFGAKNEVVSFNLVLEARNQAANTISIDFDQLNGPGGAVIASSAATGDGVFNWTQRNIEVFYIRYLQILGLSQLSYETYDERHIPKRFRRPWTGQGSGSGTWANRPDHDKYYPEIAVPIELVPSFSIQAGENQSIWADIYIPRNATPGLYSGTVAVLQGGTQIASVPVELTVRNFTLPEASSSKTMVYLGYGDVNQRYTGTRFPNAGTSQDVISKRVRDRHFQMAHRHRISLIDHDEGSTGWNQDRPRPEWEPRLSGALFTSANGYAGPGEGVGNGIYSIGTYSSWGWKGGTETDMRNRTNAWEQWFATNYPGTERFLYLIDESTNYAQTQQWASWMKNNPGIGRNLKSFATLDLPHAVSSVPSLDIAASWFAVADATQWQNAYNVVASTPPKQFYMYNGKRPASGSFATEDDGVALRQIPWGQFKKGVHRWFFWESTYYNDFQSGRGQTNVFQSALTFGGFSSTNSVVGRTGWNYSNGDGVLFYPGTDTMYASDSYGVQGPIASLRLKHWRRGIQDIDYVTLAMLINPARVQQIINTLVPKSLWEYGIADPNDPTWQRTDISWPTDPNVWEAFRKELADIIEGN